MSNVNLSLVLFGDDDPRPNEAVVQVWTERMKRGEGIPQPVLVRRKNGRCYALDADSQCRIEAAKCLGESEITAYVVAEDDTEQLERLRRALNETHRLQN